MDEKLEDFVSLLRRSGVGGSAATQPAAPAILPPRVPRPRPAAPARPKRRFPRMGRRGISLVTAVASLGFAVSALWWAAPMPRPAAPIAPRALPPAAHPILVMPAPPPEKAEQENDERVANASTKAEVPLPP